MDWQTRTYELLGSLVRSRLNRGLIVALLMVGCLVAFQVGSMTTGQPPMCELISHCHLRHGDLQRMQVALGRSGLNQFTIDGDSLLVPRQQHAEYLQAVSDENALPVELRSGEPNAVAVNPFLSRSQQRTIERDRKKRQVREMILRLPFVQQVWFEMDAVESRSPFEQTRQTAVVSVQPISDFLLNGQHVSTIRRMVAGAVAGMRSDEIEVIDVSDGYAYRCPDGDCDRQDTDPARKRLERQRFLEEQIRLSLSPRYQGVEVRVHLTACESWGHSEHSADTAVQQIKENRAPVRTASLQAVASTMAPAAKLTAGSNGVVSIYDAHANPQTPAAPIVPVQTVAWSKAEPTSDCRIAVQIDVPESALARVTASLVNRVLPAEAGDELQLKFDSVRPQIESQVAALLPHDVLAKSGSAPISVQLLREERATTLDAKAQLLALVDQHWPSAATLVIGLMLLTLVTRRPEDSDTDANAIEPSNVLPMNRSDSTESRPPVASEDRINRMLKTDPDTAAKAIEGWIRNAG